MGGFTRLVNHLRKLFLDRSNSKTVLSVICKLNIILVLYGIWLSIYALLDSLNCI